MIDIAGRHESLLGISASDFMEPTSPYWHSKYSNTQMESLLVNIISSRSQNFSITALNFICMYHYIFLFISVFFSDRTIIFTYISFACFQVPVDVLMMLVLLVVIVNAASKHINLKIPKEALAHATKLPCL